MQANYIGPETTPGLGRRNSLGTVNRRLSSNFEGLAADDRMDAQERQSKYRMLPTNFFEYSLLD